MTPSLLPNGHCCKRGQPTSSRIAWRESPGVRARKPIGPRAMAMHSARRRGFHHRYDARPDGLGQVIPSLDNERQVSRFLDQKRQAERQALVIRFRNGCTGKGLRQVGNGIENRCGACSTAGSNPALSAVPPQRPTRGQG